MIKLTMYGLKLVALGACVEGKRLFLDCAGIKNASRLGDRELDLVTASAQLVLEPTFETIVFAARSKYLSWLISNKLWFEQSALDPAVQAQLVPLLADKDGYVRQAAAQALAGTALDPAVQAQLVPLLADKEWYVRRAAAQALARTAGDPAVQVLIDKIQNEVSDG